MLRILLVEDEPPILRDILSILEKLSDSCCVIATATNGKDALSILEHSGNDIDLLLTDIQMPVVNGLELIEAVKNNYPEISCVILSGYNEFEYAKSAIQLGVCEYLLKPLHETDLETLIDRIQKENIRKKMESHVKAPIQYEHYTPENQEDVVYAVGVLCVGSLPNGDGLVSSFDECFWKDSLCNALDYLDTTTCCSYWVFPGNTYAEKKFVFRTPREKAEHILSGFFSLLIFPHFFTLGVHTGISSISEIRNTFISIRKELPHHITIEKSVIFFTQDTPPHFSEPVFYTELLVLQQLFLSLRFDSFKSELVSLLSKIKLASCTQDQLSNILFSLYSMCLSSDGREVQPRTVLDIVNNIINNSWTYQDLTEQLISLYRNLTAEKLNKGTSSINKEHLLLKIDYYIQKNYSQIRTIQDLSDKFNYSPAYLSKLFLEYKNISPTEYIINLRIEKAKELLASSKKIKEVAQYVGYNDPLYFGKLFKKRTGMSPKQYVEHSSE